MYPPPAAVIYGAPFRRMEEGKRQTTNLGVRSSKSLRARSNSLILIQNFCAIFLHLTIKLTGAAPGQHGDQFELQDWGLGCRENEKLGSSRSRPDHSAGQAFFDIVSSTSKTWLTYISPERTPKVAIQRLAA